jgi:hypothetical protein
MAMMQVPFGLLVSAELSLLPAAAGGLKSPITSGYRPICRFSKVDGGMQLVGMCQLEVVDRGSVEPGQSAMIVLRFAPSVTQLVKTLAIIGADVTLQDGTTAIGKARITAFSEIP